MTKFQMKAARLSVSAVVLLSGLAVPVAAHADPIQITYSVSLLGLPLGTGSVQGAVDRASYALDATARLTGLGAMMSSSRGAAHAGGSITGGRVAPSAYATTSSGNNMTRTVRMAMNAGTVRGVDIAPPITAVEPPGRIPVSDADKRNVVDPVSAFIMPVSGDDALVGAPACNRTLPVFDGYSRYNIVLTYVRTQTVQARGYNGPVSVCAARYVPVSGHRPDRPSTKFMADNRDMEVWLAPVERARVVVPYRIAVKTMIGTAVIEASDFSVGNTKAAASQ